MSTRLRGWLTLLAAILILAPSLWGFGAKFVELVALYRGDTQGAFAIAPIVNYLLASAGFLLLFGWAAANGMFRDIERPKHDMLSNEASLDAADRRAARNSTGANQ
jgi:nitrogen fixation-related uncharacterized protein